MGYAATEGLTWKTMYTRLPKPVYRQLRQECRVRGVSLAFMVKKAVEALLEDPKELALVQKQFHEARSVLYHGGA